MADMARSTFPLLLLVLCSPAHARLGGGIQELSSATFQPFLHMHPSAMIDFMNSSSPEYQEDSASLKEGIRKIRAIGMETVVARIDVVREPELVRRFVALGCSDVSGAGLCGTKLPQMLWFQNGQATPYSRYLRSPMNVATFIVALDREAVKTISHEPPKYEFSQVVLAKLPKHSPELLVLETLARQYMDSVAFLHVESSKRSIAWIANSTAVDYFTDPVDEAGIAHWVEVHVARSEELPAKPVDAGSVVLVGKTFDELVLRSATDVIMLAYAPWCGFSRKVMPVWAEFAHRAAGSRLLVAKMDATRNRSPTPGFSWTTYPSIIYVRKGEHVAIPFEGANRTVEALMDFAKLHSSEPLGLGSDEAIMLQSGSNLADIEL